MNLHANIFKLFFLSNIILFSFIPSQAQVLEEIPHPNDFICSDFLGGQEENLFFRYINTSGVENPSHIFQYDGMDLTPIEIPNSEGSLSYRNRYEGIDYFEGVDGNTNQRRLLAYDGVNITEVQLPTNFQLFNYVTEYENLMYIALSDEFNLVHLFSFDGATFTEIPSPDGLEFSLFNLAKDGFLYLGFNNSIYDQFLYRFDGISFESITTPPDIKFIQPLTDLGDNSYLSLVNSSNNFLLYTLSNDVLTEVPSPTDYQYFAGFADENFFYAIYLNPNTSTFEAFNHDGTSSTLMPSPPGDEFSDPYHVVTVEGVPYFTFTAGYLFTWNGSEFIQVNQPAGFQFEQYADYVDELNGKEYFIYLNTNNGNRVLMELDTNNNELIEVPSPVGDWTPDQYITTAGGKFYLTYNDPDSNEALFAFDGTDFTEITNPENRHLAFFFVESSESLFFRYDDNAIGAFSGALYKLDLPMVISETTETNLEDSQLNVYPNPFQGNIQIKDLKSSEYQITISTLTGQILLSTPLTNETLNLSYLHKGYYILTLTNIENNISRSTKVIKTK